MKQYKRAGVVARFKPLHKGSAKMLDAVCANSEYVVIGIGSSNKYNARNPFTVKESHAMIDAYLQDRHDNYQVVYVPDFAHMPEFSDGLKWKEFITTNFGTLDAFITANPYVTNLLEDIYQIVHPSILIPRDEWEWAKGSMVRYEMAQGNTWTDLVPSSVADYITQNYLDQRFRRDFGLKTLADSALSHFVEETELEELLHAKEA